MGTFLFCEARGNKRIPVESCIKLCQEKSECEEYLNVPQEILVAASKKVGMDLPKSPSALPSASAPLSKKPDVILPATEVSPVSVDEATQLYQRALAIKAAVNSSFWDLGLIFEAMYQGRHFYGFESWSEFCERGDLVTQLGLKSRAVDYLRQIVTTFPKLGVKKSDCVAIGWTKLKELPRVLTRENAKEWLKKAEDSTTEELHRKVAIATGSQSEEDAKEKPKPMSFPLFEGQRAMIDQALEVAGRITDSSSRGYALEMICVDYLSGAEGQESRPAYLKSLIGRLEAVMGIKIEAVDAKTGELL